MPAILLMLLLAAPAGAASPQDVAVLAATCVTCHGPGGAGSAGIPALRGRPAGLLAGRMRAFKAGTAPGATVMPLLMHAYDDAQIAALAAWFAGREAGR